MPAFLYLYFIGLAVLAGLLTLKINKSLPFRIFFAFISYTLINELIAYNLMLSGIKNHWLYNIYNYIRFPVLAIMYYYLMVSSVIKRVIRGFLLTVPLALALNMWIYNSFYILHTIYILYGATFIIFLSMVYLRQLFFLPLEDSLLSNSFFWIASGLLFYFLANVPYLGSVNYLVKHNKGLAIQLYLIVRIMNLLMYSLFTIAFILLWKRRKLQIS